MSPTIVLITGANSGVGFAATQVLTAASEDYHVIIASRSLDKVNAAVSEIQSASETKGRVSALQIDVTDEESIKAAAAVVEQKFGHIDVLINNAGIASQDPDAKVRFERTFNTNVFGPRVVSEHFRPLLLKSEKPVSIYVSSGMGSLAFASDPKHPYYRNLPNVDAYRSSKTALNMIAIQEAVDIEEKGVKTFTMCPGFVVSNLRGTSEEERSGWGGAGDPKVSGELILSIIEGKRDADVGKFVHSDGVYPW